MELTDDERAFIARWLLEFGSEPVPRAIRHGSQFYISGGAAPYYTLYRISDDFEYGWLHPEALEAFNKGDSNE